MFKRITEWIDGFVSWLSRVISQPRDELTRWQGAARFGYDLGRIGARQLKQDRAPQMAAALSYRTLFGLLPVLVVATVVARAVMGPDDFTAQTQNVIASFGLDDIAFTAGEGGEAAEATTEGNVGEWLQGLVEKAIGINLTAIGWIGLVVLLYSAIGLMVTIEKSFNIVTRAPEGRSWWMRVLLYWFTLTVSPVAIGLTIWFDGRVDAWLGTVAGWEWVLHGLTTAWGFVVVWLLVLAVYSLVPNRPVSLRSSLAGAFVATVLLQLGSRLFGAYLTNAVSFSQLYGSLGLIPLFMFWVYVMWLFVLFGLEVASILHSLHGRRLQELKETRPPMGVVDPASVVSVMEFAAGRFAAGHAFTIQEASEATGMPEATGKLIIDRLETEQLLNRLERPESAHALALPPEQIQTDRLLRIGFSLVDELVAPHSEGLLARLRAAQLRVAEGTTLANLGSIGSVEPA